MGGSLQCCDGVALYCNGILLWGRAISVDEVDQNGWGGGGGGGGRLLQPGLETHVVWVGGLYRQLCK